MDHSADDKFTGILERIIFRNDSNFYSVAELNLGKNKGKIVICGLLPNVQCGETLEVRGTWSGHAKHGKQLQVTHYESKLPSDVQGIRRYLSSGLIDGIGPVYAQKIVDYFGESTFSILTTQSGRLFEIPGIGQHRAKSIKASWDAQFAIRDIMIFLQTYGVTNTLCMKLYQKYGEKARTILETDPYRVAREVQGIGFKTADKIAKNIGIPGNHYSRIEAGVLYVLEDAENDGHTCMDRETLINTTQQLLEISPDKISARLEHMLSFGQIKLIHENVYQLPSYKFSEEKIVELLKQISSNKKNSLAKIWVEKAIDWAQKREGFEFAAEQIEALKLALSEKLIILTGGPGTGKTTILRALSAILRAKNMKVVLAAPTGRAAQKISETTGCEAKTIHRLLQVQPQTRSFLYNEENKLEVDFIIIDETSMLDTFLTESLLSAIPETSHIMFVGDIDQLPSVGAGNILSDFINSGLFSVVRLNRIFRQTGLSDIVSTAHNIITGTDKYPDCVANISEADPRRDVNFIATIDAEDCAEKIKNLCSTNIPAWYGIDPIDDIQVLIPTHKGIVGAENMNLIFQEEFIGSEHKNTWTIFRTGDKVIQTKNNYDKNIFNGDLGRVISVDNDEKCVYVKFTEPIKLNRAEINDLSLAYAISIHKSQGSEFPVVVIGLMKAHFILLQRNLIYTAVTRGRNKVFIVGDPAAYAMAVKNKYSKHRATGLKFLFDKKV